MKPRFLILLLVLVATITSGFGQIQPGRAIQITVAGVPPEEKARFDPIYPVSEAGMVNMPFIGMVRAAGLRAEQLAAALESRYKQAGIYTNPTFQVIDSSAKTLDEQVVFVGGDVRRTGPVAYTRTLTLYQAIQAAGGASEFGSIKRVKVFRNGKARTYDLTQGQFMSVPLEPNDTIEVPRKTIFGN